MTSGKPNGQGPTYRPYRELLRLRARAKLAQPEEAPAPQASSPVIQVVPGEMPRVTDEAEAALLQANVPIFTRAGSLVRPVTDEVPAATGRTTVVAHLRRACVHSLTDALAQVATFTRLRENQWVRIDPPPRTANTLLVREGKWHLRPIAGVITTPMLRPDGSLLADEGYDPATRLYLVPDRRLQLGSLPDRPTRADAEAALRLLRDLISSFPFVGDVDRSVALSALMTPVVRGAMPVAPLQAIRAHAPGTGKSYLIDLAAAIATGRLCPVIAAGKTEEETEKRLGALLLAGVPIISIDNVNGELGGDLLCQITKRPLVRARILGRSEAPEMENRASVFATGNNLVLLGDMTRRTLLCTLDAGLERPEQRSFPFDPIARVLRDRGSYVASVLMIARAYRAAGCPEVCAPLGSYESWSQTVRAALIWLGEADPVASMEIARAEEPELSAMRELFAHWLDRLARGSPVTARQIIEAACGQGPHGQYLTPDFRDLLLRLAGQGAEVSSKRLGKWLSKIRCRVVDGHRLEMQADAKAGNRFLLCSARTDA